VRRAFRSMTAKVAIVGVVGLTLLGGLAYAGMVPESLRTSPQEFLASLGLDPEEGENGDEENGDEEGEFDPDPLKEGSEASENASETAISVLTVIEAWHNGEFGSGCEFGQAVSAAARGDTENGENGDAVNPCENPGSIGEEMSAAGKAKGEEMSAAGKAKGEAAAAAGKAKGEEASGGAGSGGGPPAGAGPPGGTPGGP
jgi:hypothetical protein